MVVRWIGIPTIAVNVIWPYVAISTVWAGPEDGIQDEVGPVEPEGIVNGIGPKDEAQHIAPEIGPPPVPVIPIMPPMVPSSVSAEGVASMPMIVPCPVVSLATMQGMGGVSVSMASVMATTSGMMSSTMMPSAVPTAMMPSAVPTAMPR